jgi:predicted amidophosphoribosyltransferase
MKQCAFCAKNIPDGTIRCPHCGSTLAPGARTGLEDPALVEVVRLLGLGKKIDAIKRVREVYGIGLAEAKALVEGLQVPKMPKMPEMPKMPKAPGFSAPEHTAAAHTPAALTVPHSSSTGKPCPGCRNPVNVVAAYCPSCGASLLTDASTSGLPWIKILVMLAVLAVLYYALVIRGS